jgi:hypothetical protein
LGKPSYFELFSDGNDIAIPVEARQGRVFQDRFPGNGGRFAWIAADDARVMW